MFFQPCSRILLGWMVFLAGAAIGPELRAAQEKAPAKLFRRVLKASVWVLAPKTPLKRSGEMQFFSGTGWIVDVKRRLVVTNYHVVRDKKAVIVFFPTFANGKLVCERDPYLQQIGRGGGIPGTVIADHKNSDLALIRVKTLPRGAAALPLAAKSVQPDDRVFSLGNPQARPKLWRFASWTVKSISVRKVTSRAEGLEMVVQTHLIESKESDDRVESGGPGASGGPLVNEAGRLVGVAQGRVLGKTVTNGLFIDVRAVAAFLEEKRHAPERVTLTRDGPVKKTTKGNRVPEKTPKPLDQEAVARRKLRLAVLLAEAGFVKPAKKRYRELIAAFPKTKAAKEARIMLKALAK